MILAVAEAKLPADIYVVNDGLFELLRENLGRMKQSIKGRRSNTRYRGLVKKFVAELASSASSVSFVRCRSSVSDSAKCPQYPSDSLVDSADDRQLDRFGVATKKYTWFG